MSANVRHDDWETPQQFDAAQRLADSIDAVAALVNGLKSPIVWNDVTYQNDWTSFDVTETDWGRAQYAKDGLGRVHFRGLIACTTGAIFDLPIFTLPTGYRPGYKNHMFAVVTHNGVSYGQGRIDVTVDGEVIARPTGSTPVEFMSLHGISFST